MVLRDVRLLLFIASAAVLGHGAMASGDVVDSEHKEEQDEHEDEVEAHFAVLFPWFAQAAGIIVFYLGTRYFSVLPYTAIMFIIGTAMGAGAIRSGWTDQLTESILQWNLINSEVLLLVFLPGLIFRDAFGLNVHLFQVGVSQCLVMAFPMVLAGTTLVALVAYYIFPFNWSFNLAMTFGSILSATDPVAVSALLNEVGAPPRLRIHISGESLLNDGSAIVFFTIFSGMFLHQLGIEGLGETVNLGEGIALFFRMSLGGAAIGFAFGLALVSILYFLNRRLNTEENVLQVTATITIAYLTYYVAEAVAHTSGVISVVACGVFANAFGKTLINDVELMENFWVLTEHLLNTLLFVLGGVVWGAIIANVGEREFTAEDWGYLLLLFVLLLSIRFFLVFSFFPIISRIGLGTSTKEALFLSYGGLRGAVGISLAIALDNEVRASTENMEYRLFTTKLFGMVGGISLATLVINGSTAGPLLRKLGLADASNARKIILERYQKLIEAAVLDDLVHLLADPLFAKVDFSVLRHHCPFLHELTLSDIKSAALQNKDEVAPSLYQVPNLKRVVAYLTKDTKPDDPEKNDLSWMEQLGPVEEHLVDGKLKFSEDMTDIDSSALQNSSLTTNMKLQVEELRKIFIDALRYAYQKQLETGFLDAREGFVDVALLQSLDFALDSVSRGNPLNDWEFAQVVSRPIHSYARKFVLTTKSLPRCCQFSDDELHSFQYSLLRTDVYRALSFIEAHKLAQNKMQKSFCQNNAKTAPANDLVLAESKVEVQKAIHFLQLKDPDDVENVISHMVSQILLNKAARFVEKLNREGLLKDQEAGGIIEEIEEHLAVARMCSKRVH